MRIKVVGAAGGEVTGSGYLVQTESASVLIDAGMFQGGKKSEAKNRLPPGVDLSKLNVVLLTHAHLDHTGRVPLLIKHGYRGPIFATAATIDLSEIVLKDASRLQAQDAQRMNRMRAYSTDGPVEPLFRPEDVDSFRRLARCVQFRDEVQVARGITACWREAGHILGSGSIELTVEERGMSRTLIFSGDLGPRSLPIVREFEKLGRADVVFLESTYGDRDHKPYAATIAEFEDLIKLAAGTKSKILVPTFAIGRAQQILYHLAIMFYRQAVAPFPVYLDSPMALAAGKAMVQHADLFDEEMVEFKSRGLLPLDPKWFHPCVSTRESQSLDKVTEPCLILAGAGMCTGGRILRHFRENLPRETTRVLIVGYQGRGSLGRRLVEGAKSVSVLGEKVSVRSTVHTLGGFSAHAGQSDLLNWFAPLAASKPKLVLTHGEHKPREILSAVIQRRFGLPSLLPAQGEVIEI
jgi:metallo-beta-lactamase family protein